MSGSQLVYNDVLSCIHCRFRINCQNMDISSLCSKKIAQESSVADIASHLN